MARADPDPHAMQRKLSAMKFGNVNVDESMNFGNMNVDEFAKYWRLDDAARQYLGTLSMDVLTPVMRQFNPYPNTANYSAKLRVFAKAVSTRMAEAAWRPYQ